jgi:hypothetical protein
MCDGAAKVGNEGRDGTEIDVVEVRWRDGRLTMNLHCDGYGKEVDCVRVYAAEPR